MDRGPERAVGGLSVRPPAGVELRPAAREDLDAVLRLLAQRDGAAVPLENRAPAAERWEALLASVDAVPFLAIAGGEPAGLVLLVFRRRLNFATWEAWVPELVVAEAFRRRAIGRALLRVAIEEWRLRGAHRLSVELEPGEAGGAALLATLGLADTFVRFRAEPMAAVSAPRLPAEVTIRRLEPGDVEAVTRLVAEMGPHRSPVPDRMAAVERAYREIARRPADHSLLAAIDGVPVGLCTAELRATLRRTEPELWIPELVVTEPFRGRGIGAALLDACLASGTAAGAGSAVLESGTTRQVAQALYRTRGFAEAGRVFTLLRDR